MTAIDTSTEAVERLLDGVTPGPWAVDEGRNYCDVVTDYGAFDEDFVICEHAHRDARFIAAARDLVPALLKERDEARAREADANATLDAWFDRRKLGHAEIDEAVLDATKGYLRTCRVGGMPAKKSDSILAAVGDMAHLSVFADLFARALETQLTEARARAAAAFEMAADLADTTFSCSGTDAAHIIRDAIRALPTDQERDALAKVRAEAMREAADWLVTLETAAGEADISERREGIRDAASAIRRRADKIEKGEKK